MLSDLTVVADRVAVPVVDEASIAEVALPRWLRVELKAAIPRAKEVGPYSTSVEISSGNTVTFPNQYFRFAAAVFELALEVAKYITIFDSFPRTSTSLLIGTAAQIKRNLETTSEPIPLASEDIDRFAKFMSTDTKEARLGGKALLDDDGVPRAASDCFGSIILKKINIPVVSSSILGEVIYHLSINVSVYKQLVDYYSKRAPSDLKGGKAVAVAKPFILLAGISGTGKTMFIREQARRTDPDGTNYLLIPVRPDWHEPSDLLGYLSRIPEVHFVTTRLLSFFAKAWRATDCAIEEEGYRLNDLDSLVPYWVCLDEMNLAPVEQYFADFLSIVETRNWQGELYNCAPILHPGKLNLPNEALDGLRNELGFGEGDALWNHFVVDGMPLPPNLIVAGTVNMDETAHGFSRKVIDRAFTIDFGEFFPNDFDTFFFPGVAPVSLTFPRWSHITESDMIDVAADPDGLESIKFLKDVNSILKGTPFELAFRALNELLVCVRSFAPADKPALAAVFDDFLMAKLLPRLEGDAQKLDFIDDNDSLLTRLHEHVETALTTLLTTKADVDGDPDFVSMRPDLLQTASTPIYLELRTPKALTRMQARLRKHNFTSFWP